MGSVKPGLHISFSAGPRRTWLWRQLGLAAMGGVAAIQLCDLLGLGVDSGAVTAISLGYLLAVGAIGVLMGRAYPHPRLGMCNLVTLLRAALVAALIGPLLSHDPAGYGVALIGTIALALDGVDGWLARRSGLVSDFGARFDMEVDAAFALVLALNALLATGIGIGVELAILGSARYGFVAAGLFWPWLAAPLPPRFSRKAVCVLQIAVLLILQLPELPGFAPLWLARLAAVALIWSFARDVLWLWRRR